MDDIVRQFKGVSDGLMRKVSGSSSATDEQSSSNYNKNLSNKEDEIKKLILGQRTVDSANSYSDDEEGEKGASHSGERSFTETDQCYSDNELNSEELLATYDKKLRLDADKHTSKVQSESTSISSFPRANIPVTSALLEDLNGVPQEVLCIDS